MPSNRFFRPIALGFAAVLALTAPAKSETLADALAGAYEHSGLLDQNRALLRAADEDVAQAIASLRPVITYLATFQYSNVEGRFQPSGDLTGSASLNLELLLWDGGSTQFQIDALKETVLATRAGLVQVEQDVLLRAVRAYMGVRRASEFVALRRNNVRLISEELRAARDRFDVGEVTRTDVSLAEARLAAARSLLAAAEADLIAAVAEYQAAVGRDPGGLTPPRLPNGLPGDVGSAKSTAFRIHPSIDQAQHQVSAAELTIEATRAGLHPRLTAQGSLGVDENGNTSENLGLRLSGTIYQGGALSSQIRAAQARRDAVRAGLHVTRHAVEQGVANAYSQLVAARAQVVSFNQQVRAARVAFRGVREEATLGARTTLDVLNAEQELLNAQANLIAAQADEIIAAYSLLAAMGLLTVEHLGLGVQVYDPVAYYNLVDDAPTITSEQGAALDRVLRAIGEE